MAAVKWAGTGVDINPEQQSETIAIVIQSVRPHVQKTLLLPMCFNGLLGQLLWVYKLSIEYMQFYTFYVFICHRPSECKLYGHRKISSQKVVMKSKVAHLSRQLDSI